MTSRHGSRDGNGLAREVGALLLAGGAVFTIASLITWSPGDSSFLNNKAAVDLANACGIVGSWISTAFLQAFGVGAWLIPAAFAFLAYAVFQEEGRARILATMTGMTIAVLSFTLFLSLQWKFWPFAGTLLLTGGILGAWLADLLVQQFNSFGSSIVSLLVFCLALVASTPVSLARVGGKVLAWAGRVAWRFLRIAGAYAGYGAGILAMRTAHFAGDGLHRLMAYGMERARQRRLAVKPEAEGRKAGGLSGAPSDSEVESDAADSDSDSEEIEVEAEVVEPEIVFSRPITTADQMELPNVLKKPVGAPSKARTRTAPVSPADDEFDEIDMSSLGDASDAEDEEQKATGGIAILPPEADPLAMATMGGGGNAGAAEVEAPFSSPDQMAAKAAKAVKAAAAAVSRRKRGQWKLPSRNFLRTQPKVETTIDEERVKSNAELLVQKFKDFGIDGQVTAVRPGPVITLYEFKPGPGVRVSRIAALADDLSMALSAQSVRILAPIPGKSVVGIEIPSDHRQTVFFREILDQTEFFGDRHVLPVVMGKDIGGKAYISDLARMPHLLCSGTTGSGKSVFMNGLICSMLYRFTPEELRLILVDPKIIEFTPYQDIPHLLLPVVDDSRNASVALKWAVREMERRYRIMAKLDVRNLASYNQKVADLGEEAIRDLLLEGENEDGPGEKISGGDWIEAFEKDEDGDARIGKLPYIVIIIDELADLMAVAKKDVEVSIMRIAQKARAAGLHLVIATQRPSTDVITGVIKANLPSRVSFQLRSNVDSRTILDSGGAEKLLGQGDMLFVPPGTAQLLRLHGAYLDDGEINKVTSFLKEQGKPVYRTEILEDEEAEAEGADREDEEDSLFQEAVELAKRTGMVSASSLQRHFRVGYNRASRLVETMESRGIVGPADGARPREVLIR